MRFLKLSLVLLAVLGLGCGTDDAAPGNAAAAGNNGTGGVGAGGINAGGGSGQTLGGPGKVTLRRLNRREYDNTIRDLVHLDLKPSVTYQFPPEEFGDGFDND